MRFPMPVISVGNLSTGGTGKSPHIEYLIRLLSKEYQVATLSRGYRRRTKGFLMAKKQHTAYELGDEPMQFAMKFPDAVVAVCEQRIIGMPMIMSERPDVEVILLDDAFQHRSVVPGLNILLTDFQAPFYKDFVLPSGNLREWRSGYQRADMIIVSKCPPNLDMQQRAEIVRAIAPKPHQKVFFSTVRYGQMYEWQTGEPSVLRPDMHVLLLTGIAKPGPVEGHLQSMVKDVTLYSFPDHHYFTNKDLDGLHSRFLELGAKDVVIVTTEKDAARLSVKREQLQEWNLPIWILPIEIEFLSAKEEFEAQVKDFVGSTLEQYKRSQAN